MAGHATQAALKSLVCTAVFGWMQNRAISKSAHQSLSVFEPFCPLVASSDYCVSAHQWGETSGLMMSLVKFVMMAPQFGMILTKKLKILVNVRDTKGLWPTTVIFKNLLINI